MTTPRVLRSALLTAAFLVPTLAFAQQASPALPSPDASSAMSASQQNVPPAAQHAEDSVERTVRKFRVGVEGGVSLDPELIDFGAHAAFGPIFVRNVDFRPGIEFGLGELTTMFGVNLDVLYTLAGATRQTRWVPYIGAGPNFALSHRGFQSTANGNGNVDNGNRFNFSDTKFNNGFNFIAGARSQGRVFMEMKATAWGVSNVRLLGGFNF
jgi:hypothetical protein